MNQFKIIIEGDYSERFIGIIEIEDLTDAISNEYEFFEDYMSENQINWFDLECHDFNHDNGMHSGTIIIEQNNKKTIKYPIEDFVEGSFRTIDELVNGLNWPPGFYYCRIEWEGKGEKIKLEGQLNEDYDIDSLIDSTDCPDTGVISEIYTNSNIDTIELNEFKGSHPKGGEGVLFFSKGDNGDGWEKRHAQSVDLDEITSDMKKNNIDLSNKEMILKYLNNLLS